MSFADQTTLAVLAEQLGTGQRDGDTDSSSGDSAGETDQGDMDGTDGYEEEGDAEGDQDVLQPFQMDIIHEYYGQFSLTVYSPTLAPYTHWPFDAPFLQHIPG